MRKKIAAIVIVSFLGLVVMLAGGGCGGDGSGASGTGDAGPNLPATAGNTLNDRIQALKNMEMTVEVIADADENLSGKWSQKAGSWRWEASKETNYYVIHNNALQKTWKVAVNPGSTPIDYRIYLGNEVKQSGTLQPGESVALEISSSSESSIEALNPANVMSAFAMIPRTGGTDDAWEINDPNVGKITIEMKGPNGLPTKITSEDAQTGVTSTMQFVYSNIGNLPDSLFELPPNAKVTTVDSGTPAGSSDSGSSGSGSSGPNSGGDVIVPDSSAVNPSR